MRNTEGITFFTVFKVLQRVTKWAKALHSETEESQLRSHYVPGTEPRYKTYSGF